MRAGVDYIGVGVGAMIFNDEGKVFLAQRGENAGNERGKWEFPGGELDYGEKLVDGIRREIKEEFGIEIEVVELLGVHDHILLDESQHWVSPTYIARLLGGEPTICEPDKCSALGWFDFEDLPGPLSVISQEDIRLYRAKTGPTS